MYKKIICYFCSIFLLTPCYLQAATACEHWIAKIVSAQGMVDVKYLDQTQWKSAHQNDFLCNGDGVRTGKNSRVVLMFTNQALATLDQNAALIFPVPKTKKHAWYLRLLEGSIFFRSRNNYELDIDTPFLNAVHKGTEFMVTVTSNKTQVAVFDGAVAASNAAGKVLITQGLVGEAGANQAPQLHALTVSPQDAVQWSLYYPPIADYQTLKLSAVDANLRSALMAYQHGDVFAALKALDNVPETARNSGYLNFSASLLLTVGRVDAARVQLEQIFSLEPNNTDAIALQAIIAVAQNHQQAALDYARKAVSFKPKSAVAHLALSYAYQAQFNIDAALKATQLATDLAPDNALAWARLAELQLCVGDRVAALIAAKKAQALNPHLAKIHIIKGFTELAENTIASAERAFTQAINLDSSDPMARLGLALAKIKQGQLDAGKCDLEIAVNLDPNNAILRSYLGKAFYELKNKEFATKEFTIAKTMDSKDPTPWFYDAILKQATNRPVEALHDMQKAIELNGNRGVYRSKLLLDKDKAARQVGLGRIYNNLGFDDVANRLAMTSLATDPNNYSAHRLLSDSYMVKPRHEIARSSEYLQSQLLQPLNYNPIQPSLAYSDLNIIKGIGLVDTSFNEYNRLFERNGVRFTSTGIAGSNSLLGDEAALSGIYNKFSFSLGQLHYATDGFQDNKGFKHAIYSAFTQYEMSPSVNIQAEYRHRETEQGDLALKGYAETSLAYKRNINQDSYRYGMKFSPTQYSAMLLSFIHTDRKENTNHDIQKTSSNNFEAQYLFDNTILNIMLGGGAYLNDNNSYTEKCIDKVCPHVVSNIGQYFGYLYSNYKFFDNLNVTSGLSFDHYIDNKMSADFTLNELNPKLGLFWTVNKYVTVRAAVFKTVKSAITDNQILQSTQVAGFNQFFDDINGTTAWQYGFGIDTHILKNSYAGIEIFKRDLKIPTFVGRQDFITGKSVDFFIKPTEEIYRLYFNWTPHDNWVLNAEFRFENYRSDGSFPVFPKFVETAYIPLEIKFFHPAGFFATVKGTYVNQKTQAAALDLEKVGSFNSDFYLVDAAIGYRFPKQYGLISLEAKNIFDNNFIYRDRQYQLNEQHSPDFFPERTLFSRITLNF